MAGCTWMLCVVVLIMPCIGRVTYPAPSIDWTSMHVNEINETEKRIQPNKNKAKNVILFIGDGMGLSTVTAARIYKGQQMGASGEEGYLRFEKFPHVGLSKTYNTDYQISDSAGTATALLTGVNTKFAAIGVSNDVSIGNCSTLHGNELESFTTMMLKEGKSVGFVTNTRVTHATPAATYAHSVSRYWEADFNQPPEVYHECPDIGRQLFRNNTGIHVIMGGGRRLLTSTEIPDPDQQYGNGLRKDGLNLIQEWKDDKEERLLKHAYVWNSEGLKNVDVNQVDYLLGLFAPSHMKYEPERTSEEPSLVEMTETAIKILRKKSEGFFLMVEGGNIDQAHHKNFGKKSLEETVVFADAVKKAVEMTNSEETLIIVTADHSHAFTMGGHPERGDSVTGLNYDTWTKPLDGLPYTILTYVNGPGGSTVRRNVTGVDVEAMEYQQEALVPLVEASHAGEDVPIYASGPQAHLIHSVHEQSYVAHVMMYATCMGPYLRNCPHDQLTSGSNSSVYLSGYLAVFLITGRVVVISLLYFVYRHGYIGKKLA